LGQPLRALALKSFAKVNLGLEVLRRRDDGFHELRTLFQTIDLHDDIVLRDARRHVSLSCDDARLPKDETNLALAAAQALRGFAKVSRGVEISLVKRIPVAGGLGGGSSNAAAVLLGLDRLWGTRLGRAGLYPLAAKLGADVPFFLIGGTALGLGRGDEVYPLRKQVQGHLVVVDLKRPVSTRAVFSRFDNQLTHHKNSNTIFCFVSRDLEGEDDYSSLSNDLERAALEEAPELADQVRQIRGILVREGALVASLSGSGSSVFGLFGAGRPAQAAHTCLARAGFLSLRARTLSLEQYRRAWSRSLGGRRIR